MTTTRSSWAQLALAATAGLGLATPTWAATGSVGRCGARAAEAPVSMPSHLDPVADPAAAAREAHRRGDLAIAAAYWLQAAGEVGSSLERAEAIGRAGELRAALGFDEEGRALLLESLEVLSEARSDRAPGYRAALARILADAGDLEGARVQLERARDEARSSADAATQAKIGFSLADLRRREGATAEALEAFAAASALAAEAGDPLLAAQSDAEVLRLRIESRGEAAPTNTLIAQSDATLASALALPATGAKAQLLIHVGRTLERLGPAGLERANRAYLAAADTAEPLGAHASQAFALGYRAALYERIGQIEDADRLTRSALLVAERGRVDAARYRFDAQWGRLLEAQGDRHAALAAYRRALRTLERMRAGGAGQSLVFGRTVEPVYLQLVDLLLREAEATDDAGRRRDLLREARNRVEDMKSVELIDHFKDACLVEEHKQSVESAGNALVVYPILLADRTALILARDDVISSLTVAVTKERLEQEVNDFRRTLQKRSRRDYLVHAARLYDWLIRPFESQLSGGSDAPDALVFVPAGALRTIPMSSLYDRDERSFLIEKIPIAVVPALTLTDPEAIARESVRSLLAGITEARQGFPALQNVQSEIDALGDILVAPDPLMNAGFSTSALESAISNESFGIVHIASHGRFDAESSKSFLLTYDGQVGMDQLAALVERRRISGSPVELLTLSACETAVGDERAGLGLAGVAVRAGARSALATLWTVNDQAASELIAEFYRQLMVEEAPRGEALRRAQIMLLESRPYRHPGYWSPFVLISNWM